MTRSLKKSPLNFVHSSILEKIEKGNKTDQTNKVIKTWSRESTIVPSMLNWTFRVHNGKSFTSVFIEPNMVDGRHKLGDMVPTRRQGTPGKKGNRSKR